MTKIYLLLLVVVITGISSCDKGSAGTNFNFSNSLPPYAALNDTNSIHAIEGDSASVKFVVRTAFNKTDQMVSITYTVSGAVNLTGQTVVIPRNTLSAIAKFMVPSDIITDPGPNATVSAMVSLTKAVTSDGITLRIGQNDDPSLQKVRVVISKP